MGKIYCFCNSKKGDSGPGYAVSEDGVVLVTTFLREGRVKKELAVDRPEYASHYPDGYEVEYIPHSKLDTHKGLKEVLSKAHRRGNV